MERTILKRNNKAALNLLEQLYLCRIFHDAFKEVICLGQFLYLSP